jgi:hypothetical protein
MGKLAFAAGGLRKQESNIALFIGSCGISLQASPGKILNFVIDGPWPDHRHNTSIGSHAPDLCSIRGPQFGNEQTMR